MSGKDEQKHKMSQKELERLEEELIMREEALSAREEEFRSKIQEILRISDSMQPAGPIDEAALSHHAAGALGYMNMNIDPAILSSGGNPVAGNTQGNTVAHHYPAAVAGEQPSPEEQAAVAPDSPGGLEEEDLGRQVTYENEVHQLVRYRRLEGWWLSDDKDRFHCLACGSSLKNTKGNLDTHYVRQHKVRPR
ncbi:hypothetical protein F4778DRAFT_775429 [Xylariomycetidae sp. FL2044]|nr:hypothetical protein F4778DRAFT_775429 [Xylariomycetidae sp. FL2044]